MAYKSTIKRILLLSLVILAVGSTVVMPVAGHEHVAGRLVVQTRIGADPGAVVRVLAAHGVRVHERHLNTDVWVLDAPESRLDAIKLKLEKTGLFTFVEPDYIAKTAATPNDPDFASQWHLTKIQAPSAWDISTGSTGVTIALIDSGVDPTHPDLAPKLVPGYNFVNSTSNTADLNGHGTETAGVAAAGSNNAIGITGVAWNNPIMPVVACDQYGNASYTNIANGITYAADHGARVISISLIGVSPSSVLQNAVDYAWSKGAVIFAGAGNFGATLPVYPAACNNVLAVSATDTNENLASFSEYGSFISLSAPGVSIMTTMLGGGYGYDNGTSFSAPIAAGVGALVLSLRPSLTNSAVVSLLEQNSDDLGLPGWDQYFGWGRVNAYKAVKAALSQPVNPPPVAAISNPAAGATVSGTTQVQGTATSSVGLSRVDFLVDNALVASSASSPFTFSLTTTAYSNGGHTLLVNAYDTSGNKGSAAASVTVNNVLGQPPTVAITSPTAGTTISGTAQVQGTATSSVGLSRVDFLVDKALVSSAASSPFNFSMNTASYANGAHTLSVNAYDTAGNKGSASVSVTVNNNISAPLTVSITSPVNGYKVSGTVPISVSATSSIGVSQVVIYIDGVKVYSGTSAPYGYSWNTKHTSSGTHQITATAWDKAGNPAYAVPITVIK